MKLSAENQQLLLSLAEADTALAAAHRPATLVEQKELDELIAARGQLRDGAAVSKMGAHDLRRDLSRMEHDLAKLQRRAKANIAGLGAAVDVEQRRDLEHDLSSTKRRIARLEEEKAELARRISATDLHHTSDGARHDDMEARIDAARRALRAAEDAAEARRVDMENTRNRLREQLAAVDAAALDSYDEQYESFGVGAARFRGNTCTGCYLVLPAAGVAAVRNAPADVVPQCPECGTWLVRS